MQSFKSNNKLTPDEIELIDDLVTEFNKLSDESSSFDNIIKLLNNEPIENESIENIIATKKQLILPPNNKFIYGGSVDEENIAQYLEVNEIDGFLIGKASLDPNQFLRLVNA